MSSAKLYVSTNVVDRLTRPIATPGPAGPDDSLVAFDTSFSLGGAPTRPVIDMASFMGSLGGAGEGAHTSDAFNTPGQRPRPASAATGARGSANKASSEGNDAKEKALKFQQFLERQNQVTKRKEDTIKQVRLYALSAT